MKTNISILVIILTTSIYSQSSYKSFFELSGPKRTWVLFHPFKAKKSLEVSKEANKVADSIKKSNFRNN